MKRNDGWFAVGAALALGGAVLFVGALAWKLVPAIGEWWARLDQPDRLAWLACLVVIAGWLLVVWGARDEKPADAPARRR